LGFVVTPKSRQSGVFLNLVRPQLIMMGLIVLSVVYGSVRLALGTTDDVAGFLVNVFWSCYNLVMLSVVIVAATYAPPGDEAVVNADRVTAATVTGRISGGSVR
jgi:cellulose synthase (UDP-forming)